ncbi:MAG: class A beta-lactamase-related serine hydrolase [Pedosphaera sp.]|nr:class A beta-lactamase-related serine hydrolase [Pedosphaera sp.]
MSVALALLFFNACTVPNVTPIPQPSTSPIQFNSAKLAALDAAIQKAIAEKKLPGGVLWIERNGTTYQKSYGLRSVRPESEPMTLDTIFDLASLTKAIATGPAIALLIERNQVALDAPVRNYIPEFAGEGRDLITLRHLLTHSSGLRPGLSLATPWLGTSGAIGLACRELPTTPAGTKFVYSDINFILLGEIVHRVSKSPLDEFVAREFFAPLRMTHTSFRPSTNEIARIAPTTTNAVRGIVHDPTARRMGGVAGHAGLFATASDTARFARMLLGEGSIEGTRVLKAETVKLMTSNQSPEPLAAKRGLGWDIDTGYSGPRGEHFPVGSFGHTGWTGTSIWIDPASKSFVIFSSNRNHPDESGSVVALRKIIGTLAAEAVGLPTKRD